MSEQKNDSTDTKARFGALRDAFLTAAPVATRVFAEFIIAAEKLKQHERRRAFAAAATPAQDRNHLEHLRDADHMAALKRFSGAKEDLLDVDKNIGGEIAQIIEKDMQPRIIPFQRK